MGERGKGRESSVKRFGAGTEGGCCSVLENIAGITQSRKNRMKQARRGNIACTATPITIIDNNISFFLLCFTLLFAFVFPLHLSAF